MIKLYLYHHREDRMKRWESLQEVKYLVQIVNRRLLNFLVRPQEGFQSNALPAAADGPSHCLRSRWRSSSVWRFIDARSPSARTCHRLPPLESWRGGTCWDERVCLCVCSSSGSKAINPVPKCQVACQHANHCHPSLSQTKGPSVLSNVGLRMGNDDLSCMEKG